jgi:hypothetical protein
LTRPIVIRRLDGPKHCIWTRIVAMPIIRVGHEAVDLKVLAVPDEVVARGSPRSLPDSTARIAAWLDALGQVAEEA